MGGGPVNKIELSTSAKADVMCALLPVPQSRSQHIERQKHHTTSAAVADDHRRIFRQRFLVWTLHRLTRELMAQVGQQVTEGNFPRADSRTATLQNLMCHLRANVFGADISLEACTVAAC